jgi:hypothetical protein
VHFHILELFYDINLMMIAASGAPIHRGSTLYDMITSQSNIAQPFGAPPGFMGGAAPRSPVIPMSSLQSIGLHADVVTRLREVQSYLNQVTPPSPPSPPIPSHFLWLPQLGLDLQVIDTRPQMPPVGFPSNEYPHHAHVGGPSPHSPGGPTGTQDGYRKLEFFIPRETVGGIIGRGGQGLRDLMHETGCKIYIDKFESEGSRLVRIISNLPPGTVEEETNLQFAKEILLKRAAEVKDSVGDLLDA